MRKQGGPMEMIKIKVYVDTGFAGCEHVDYIEIPKTEWYAMSTVDQDRLLDDAAKELLGNNIDYGAYVVTDEEEE